MKYNISNSYDFLKKHLLLLVMVAVLSQGCASNSQNNKRLERYQPIVTHRNYQLPKVKVVPEQAEQVKKSKTVKADVAEVNKSVVSVKKPVKVKTPAVVKSAPAVADNIDNTGATRIMRKLKHGDRVTVGLYGIPDKVEVKESIDDFGSITLPLIDVIKIVGLSTSAAERKIRDAYINSGFYTDLSVVVIAMADEYFIKGEVKKVGNYPLIGDLTLLQAITSAGGYTDYAKLSKVTILRLGKEPKVYDCRKIAKRRISDPLIRSGDIITVPRRILWK